VLRNYLFVVLRCTNQTVWPSLSITQSAVTWCASDLSASPQNLLTALTTPLALYDSKHPFICPSARHTSSLPMTHHSIGLPSTNYIRFTIPRYRSAVFHAVWYGCKTWTLTLRLGLFQNRVLRIMFKPGREERTGGWRNCIMTSCGIWSPHRILVGWDGWRMWHGRRKEKFKVLAGKPEGKTPLRRPRYRWDDNSEMDLKELMSTGSPSRG